jgi:Rhodopirellula transposase DDE domain
MQPDVLWTDLSLAHIAHELTERGTPLSPPTVKQWLAEHGLAKRQIAKTLPGGVSPDRNTQFDYIAALRAQYVAAGNPIFSLDTKKKEHLGGCIARAGCIVRRRFRPSIMTFRVGPPAW